MTRRLALFFSVSILGVWLAGSAGAASFALNGGGELVGDPPYLPSEAGLVVKKPDGNFSLRVAWTNFTEAALKQMAKDPQIRKFVEPLLELEEEETARKQALEIKVKPAPRLERPDPKAGFGAIFSSPLSVTIFIALYLANLYGAYEVARFRNYHPGAVCGVSAIAPIIGQVIFLCLPTYIKSSRAEEVAEEEYLDEAVPAEVAAGEAGPDAHAEAAAHAAASAPKLPPPTVYQRGHTTFNRRFFETKLSGFMRMVPSDAEKDMVILVRSTRGEHVATRISRITPNDLTLQIAKGGASSDVTVQFTEISELQIRHKDA